MYHHIYIYIYMYIYIYIYMYMCIYIYRERERDITSGAFTRSIHIGYYRSIIMIGVFI